MLDAILMPERMEPVAREYLQPRLVARMWPPEVASKPFVDFLKAQYDHTQLQAIEARGEPLGLGLNGLLCARVNSYVTRLGTCLAA